MSLTEAFWIFVMLSALQPIIPSESAWQRSEVRPPAADGVRRGLDRPPDALEQHGRAGQGLPGLQRPVIRRPGEAHRLIEARDRGALDGGLRNVPDDQEGYEDLGATGAWVTVRQHERRG